ncbi:hypothetical protein H4582DRAFT_2070874 [Lactarius indigo]|nr:hypothetical protein H4582DRAFT_2070874 [Lactarius indigo]
MSFAETALSVLGSPPIAGPGRFLRSLPDIVRRILPHARYSSFLETLATGSRGCDIPARKTPSSPIQDNTPKNSLTQSGQPRHTGTSNLGWEPQAPSSCPDDLVFRILYKTHGKHAWMNGRTIESVKVLKWLGGEYLFPKGIMSSAHIKSGNIRKRCQDGWESVTFNYICKTWDMSKMGQWDGFYSELALYKSSRYLLPLQGDVVPHVMGIYTGPGKIDIAMDLPHPVFWMEASASMPMVLKDRVVEAFQKLHERGIVHGDVALRHILIGADARVTLIDFQASRADDPNEDLGLAATYPGEKELEMRRVKFLLNMDNARQKEFRKSKAAHKRAVRNKARAQRRRELLRHGITMGLPVDEPEPQADAHEPPVPLDELERYWMEDANDDPRRFIVPGSSESKVARAISSFLQRIRDMEESDCDWSVAGNSPSSPRSPLASPSCRLEDSVPELPPSIKVRDFAYGSTHSICGLQAEHGGSPGDPSCSLGPAEAGGPRDKGNNLTLTSGCMKRRRESDEDERTTFVEKLPAGKRTRLSYSEEGSTGVA